MHTWNARQFCGLVLAIAAGILLTDPASAQLAEEPASAPPLFSERTHAQVEEFLSLAPPGASTGVKPGLRVFTTSRVEPADLLGVFIACFASLGLTAPGAFLIYASLPSRQLDKELARKSLAAIAVLSLAWVLFLYSLAFARNAHSYDVLEKEIQVIDRSTAPGSLFIGDLSRWGLRGLSSHWTADKVHYPLRRMGDPIAEVHFMTFQLTLFLQAVVPLLLLTTRIARSWGHVLFWLLWSTLVYAPVTYWTQGGGWLAEVVDAGSSVPLHLCVGFTALGLMLAGSSAGEPTHGVPCPVATAQPVFLAIGGMLFVSGNLLLAGSRSAVFHPWATFDALNVFLAACVGLLTWMVLDHRFGQRDGSALLFGTVSGIVSISAGGSSVAPVFAIVIAAFGASVSYIIAHALRAKAQRLEWRLFAVHGMSALVGLPLAGVFATADVAGIDSSGRPIIGLVSGNFELWRVQALTGSIATVLALAMGFLLPIIVRIVDVRPTRRSAPDMRAEPTPTDAKILEA